MSLDIGFFDWGESRYLPWFVWKRHNENA